jgi:hypothetical protein
MCCFFTALVFFGPRLAILVWWLMNPVYINAAFSTWIWPLLGFIFLPWTLLMFYIIYPGGITGFDWVWLAIGLFADIASYSGGAWGQRGRFGYQN